MRKSQKNFNIKFPSDHIISPTDTQLSNTQSYQLGPKYFINIGLLKRTDNSANLYIKSL